ncbi:hypothetical protein D8B26_008147 [Coccidioides posadasii str. Silveira]|uniref:Uncharacterized protein n=1 Tax=Coccidioides posadasii (strain RMSCC 757 / Silveira) TaxID=443226 RepID=E9DDT1_COCPS|nr:conserved hypothetical protein [Coccidioides posadasii str. Silveira]QVM13539.1 hypothetical protein D8B26_008147 [Coccidioides posadasii str. Silveira]
MVTASPSPLASVKETHTLMKSEPTASFSPIFLHTTTAHKSTLTFVPLNTVASRRLSIHFSLKLSRATTCSNPFNSAEMSSTAVPRQPTSTGSTPGMPPRSVDGPAVEVRCSRCQLSLSPEKSVQFGINCYYCPRCASMVGYKR